MRGDEEARVLGKILKKRGVIKEKQLEKAMELLEQGNDSLGEQLITMGIANADEVYSAMAEQFGMEEMEDLSLCTFPPEAIQKTPYSFARKHLTIPVREEEETIVVATHDPLNLNALDDLQMMLNRPIEAVFARREVIQDALHLCYNREEGAAQQLLSGLKGEGEGEDGEGEVYDLLEEKPGQSPIIKLLNLILTEAIQQGASDIHFEPQENDLRIRYRIDGVLQNRHSPALEYQGQLLTRVKVMAKLDIAERRLPQDGRIKLRMGGREIDFRVSTVPVTNGERIVLRILDKGNVLLGLGRIGMLSDVFEEFKQVIRMPEGILLVTGPTGSGKTTTLYSAVADVYSDEINIMTIEDPVEYKLPGIAQIGVKPKINLTFAAGLRTILRQDPDVVMVGEIRDKETADIAIQASLTGHLVLSTLHTNDAPSALTRLVDMGVEPYLLSSSVLAVLAQRLVRTLCPHCKEPYKPAKQELDQLGLRRKDLPEGVFYQAKGCSKCFHTGYKGRHGIYEYMPMSSSLKHQVVKSPDALALRSLAKKEGMVSLHQHGAWLVAQGLTTEEEVLRVTRAVSEEE